MLECLSAPAAVEQRIASWTLLPAYNGEGMQVLRYENTQKYEPHWVSHLTGCWHSRGAFASGC
jgi:hypothetical protein